MAHRIICILLLSISLSSQCQSFQIDSTFQPSLDIRNQRGAQIHDLFESLTDGKVYLAGDFRATNGQIPYTGSVCYERGGEVFSSYKCYVGLGSFRTFFEVNSDTFFIANGSNAFLIDPLGDTIERTWRLNYLKTVRCATGIPYFFPDGSSLFANGRDGSGDPCDIGIPDSTNPGSHIMKLTPEGLWDSTFSVTSSRNPRGFFPYDSARIIVYGNPRDFMTYNGFQIDGMCRIFLDGRLDTSFHSPLQGINASSEAIPALVQDDGSFLIRGRFILKENPNYQTLAKLNKDGSLDTDFMNFSGATDSIYFASVDAIAPAEDGGYLVGGRFDSYQRATKNCLAKIDSNGKLQSQFFTNYGPDSANQAGIFVRPEINVIEKSKFGGYYVGGWFTTWDGKPSQPIVRLTGLDSADLVDTSTSIREFRNKDSQVRLYPNPADESVTIQSMQQDKILDFKLYNLQGKSLQVNSYKTSPYQIKLDLNALKPGIYFLQLELENGILLSKKVIKN